MTTTDDVQFTSDNPPESLVRSLNWFVTPYSLRVVDLPVHVRGPGTLTVHTVSRITVTRIHSSSLMITGLFRRSPGKGLLVSP